MGLHIIPPPRSLHNRAAFGRPEKPLNDLPFFSIVSSYLDNNMGEGYTTLSLFGVSSRELAAIAINTDEDYEQALDVAQYLWDVGYYVLFSPVRVPGRITDAPTGPTVMYICWSPELLKKRNVVCPCWTCPISFKEKRECLGCDKYRAFLSSQRRK